MSRQRKFPIEWLGSPMLGYVVNDLRANYWKVEALMTRDDAVQEGYIVFAKVRERYAETAQGPAHFFTLFKTSWHRHMINLAYKATNVREHEVEELPEHVGVIGERDNEGVMLTMIRQAPREVAMVLSLFLRAPEELLENALSGWSGKKDRRMKCNNSGRINALLGFPAEQDTMQMVRDYLSPN